MRPIFPQTRQGHYRKGKIQANVFYKHVYNTDMYTSILNKYKQTKCSNIKSERTFNTI